MKKIFLLLISLAVATLSFGQLNDNRTATTRVSDALAQLPARDGATLEYVMGDLASAGAEGVSLLTGMFTDVNNVPVNYALNGLSFYLSGEDRQSQRKVFEEGILSALAKATDRGVKSFYITLLSQSGSDASVPVLAHYITDPVMAEYALATLAAMNTPAAKEAVKMAVEGGSGDRLALANAASYMNIPGIYPYLESWLTGSDMAFDGPILFAMARTGDYEAVKYFDAKVKADKYAGTGNDILYVEALNGYKKANAPEAAKRAGELTTKALKSGNDNLALAAFRVYADAGGSDISKYTVSAMDNGNRVYRAGVLKVTEPYANDGLYENLLKKAGKSKSPEVKEDIFYFIGQNSDKYAQGLTKYFNDANDDVAVAAIEAYSYGRDYPVAPALLPLLAQDRSEKFMAAVKDAVIAQSNESVRSATSDWQLDDIFATANYDGKVAVLEIIGAKQLTDYMAMVLVGAHDDGRIAMAGYNALGGIAREKDLPMLFQMLGNFDDVSPAIPSIQEAIINAMYDMSPDARIGLIETNMNNAKGYKAPYYTLLAASGDDAALALLEKAYAGENAAGKTEVVKALALRGDIPAAEYLYSIAKNDRNKPALEAYIGTIANSDLNAERKLIKLAAAAEITNDAALRARIVSESGKLHTFQSLLFTGGFLDDGDATVRDLAAQGVMNIAMANEDIYGREITQLLEKASGSLSNPDAQYHRQAIANHLSGLPKEGGFISIFNGHDLTGWKGIVENPIARANMSAKELEKKQAAADELMRRNWTVINGSIVYIGDGYDNICTVKDYGDIEMYLDWRLWPGEVEGDGGIYLRGTPQVQIWDTNRTDQPSHVGSGGLYNNQIEGNNPLVFADNKTGEWNTFRIRQKGERVTVWLNGYLVVDNVPLENFWDRSQPLFTTGQIELQGHTTRIDHRNIYVKELPMAEPYKVSDEERAEGFVELFDGLSLDGWYGNTRDYVAEDGEIVLYPSGGWGGNLYTEQEYGDFVLRFEFMLTPAANNGIGIRTPDEGDAAYVGMEIQVLDDTDPIYANLAHYQYHGSVYGVIAAQRGHLRPLGEWNVEEIYANGNHIRVTLNGVVIVDGDIAEASKSGTLDGLDHPGLKNKKGHIAFLGHGSPVKFRNLRIKVLD